MKTLIRNTLYIETCFVKLGDNFDTQLNVKGGGESSRLTNYAAFMLGIVLPDSYSQSLANNYKWQSKVINFHRPKFPFHPSLHKSETSSDTILDEEHHTVTNRKLLLA